MAQQNIGGFEFGGSVRDRHMYICKGMYKILADFSLAVMKVDRQTAKFNSPPNFLPIQYMQITLYESQLLVA